jgi:ribose transport system substrate-binding protein
MAAESILTKLPSQSRVGILTSNQSNTQLEARLQGIRKTLGYRRIATVVETEPDYHSSIAALETAMEEDRNDQIRGWIFLDDWPLLGMPALPWQAGELAVVAIQSSPSAFIYIDQGYLHALVVHPYYDWGYLSVEKMIEKLHLGEQPEEPVLLTSPILVDWRNIEDYRENWKNWFR